MAAERDFELLDDYLANRLSGADKTAFEQKLEADPELKSEYQVQRQLVEGIKGARMAELKSLLNNIPVTGVSGGETLSFTKIASFILLAGVIATGIYFLFFQEEKPVTAENIETVTETEPEIEDSEPVTSAEQPSEIEQEAVQKEEETTEEIAQPVEKKGERIQKPDNVKPEQETAQPKLEVFDPTKELENGKADKAESELNSAAVTNPTIVVETDATNKRYNFHYHFKDEKLFLYGPFEKNLYEILEFFSDNKRTVFLFFRDDYYLLDEAQSKVTALKPITDTTLLKKLKEYRANN
jgi:hypothetical protein